MDAAHVRPGDNPGPVSRNWRLNFANSAWTWMGLMVYLVLVQLYVLFIGAGLEGDPRLGLFEWLPILAYSLAGLAGIFFASRTGFPAALDPQISNRYRLVLPLSVGLGFGLLTILIEQFTHGIDLFLAATGLARFNAGLPGSLFLYSGGAVILELFYRLLPVSLGLWLISSVILRGRWQTQVFWVLAAITSTFEPSGQTGMLLERNLPAFLALYSSGFALNLTQAYFFREYGFLAALSVRLGDYLVWHIIYGNLICNC